MPRLPLVLTLLAAPALAQVAIHTDPLASWGGSSDQVLARDGSGTLFCVVTRETSTAEHELRIHRSTDGGATWSMDASVVNDASSGLMPPNASNVSAAAIDSAGLLHITWGSYYYRQEDDALRVEVTPEPASFRERLTFEFDAVDEGSARCSLWWDELRVPFQIEVDVPARMVDYARDVYLNGLPGFTWRGWYEARARSSSDSTRAAPFTRRQVMSTPSNGSSPSPVSRGPAVSSRWSTCVARCPARPKP